MDNSPDYIENSVLDGEQVKVSEPQIQEQKNDFVMGNDFWQKLENEWFLIKKDYSSEITSAMTKEGLITGNGRQIFSDINSISGLITVMLEQTTFEENIVRKCFVKNAGRISEEVKKKLDKILKNDDIDIFTLSADYNVPAFTLREDDYSKVEKTSFGTVGKDYLPASYFAAYTMACDKKYGRFSLLVDSEKLFKKDNTKYKNLAESLNSVAKKIEARIDKLFINKTEVANSSEANQSSQKMKVTKHSPSHGDSVNVVLSNGSNKVLGIAKSAPNKPKFCRKCGADLIDGAKFCRKCGTKIVLLEEMQ